MRFSFLNLSFFCFVANFFSISFGNVADHSLILKTNGSLWAFGDNHYGQLGDGTTIQRNFPIQILNEGVAQVAAGRSFSLILKTDGSLYAFGRNEFGQLGDGTNVDKLVPTMIFSSGVAQIACGYSHSLILKTDGSLYTFGRNDSGQLGDGTNVNKLTPTQILTAGVSQIACGVYHSLIIKSDGSLHTFGINDYGQLGDGSTTNRNIPTQILNLGVIKIAAGRYHSLIIKSDGSLHTFGSGQNGKLGDGTFNDRRTPTQIINSDVVQISAGFYHSIIRKNNGSVYTFGKNHFGQLGDNSNSDRNIPTQIVSSGATQISSGRYYSKVLKQDGSLHTFGRNEFGQLGDGTTSDQMAPRQVLATGVARLSECISLGNSFPRDLNSSTNLNISENQPIGSVVGEFNATDSDTNSALSYYLVSGVGDGNNTLFSLDQNGTLKTATVFDFESNASTYSIRVQARDEYNASVEGNFTVTLLDIFESADIQIFSNSSAGVNLNLEPGDYKLKYLSGGYLYATGRYRTHTSFAKNRSLGADYVFFPGGDYYSVSSIESGLDPKEYDFSIETQSTVSIWHYDASYGDNSGSMWLRVEKVQNIPPSSLTPINLLLISENQPIGSVVDEFNATDLDTNSILTYHLVSGEGDDNNTLFTLDQNGTLKTATVFDFESNASSYSIRVQVSDVENASLEGNFTVVLTNDVHEDSDGDGFSDVLEASAGTNPNQASSKPGLNFGLVAWYPFDGNASDMSGNGNHGTVNGATLGTDRHGVAGKAYSFDGVDDYIESTGDFVCPKYSIGAWLRSQSDGQRNIMTIKQVDSHYNTYLALEHYPVDSSHRFRYLHRNPPGNSGGIDAYSTNSLNDGFWYYINAIHDGSVNALFVNGEKVSEVSVTDSFSLVSGLLHVGVNNENRYFHGSIDDIRLRPCHICRRNSIAL